MKDCYKRPGVLLIWLITTAYALLIVGCLPADRPVQEQETTAVPAETTEQDEHNEAESQHEGKGEMLSLPELEAAELNGEPLKVVATTSVIGDVVAQVGGDAIQLTTLIGRGQDSHSYEPATQDLTAVAEASVIFVNGWNLEERLIDNLESIGEDTPLVPVSANIVPLAVAGETDEHQEEGEEAAEDGEHEDEGQEAAEDEDHEDEDEHDHSGGDPHTWFSVHNVEQWVENIEHTLSDLDPANAAMYKSNAAAYRAQLEELEGYAAAQLAGIAANNRVLVTNHDSFAYLAHEYDFEILGTVIPGVSTLAEPSASDLAGLIEVMREHGVCTIFTETSVSDSLARAVAAELTSCEQVQVLPLYTESVGPAGSGADSYIGMFRSNVDTIVQGLN